MLDFFINKVLFWFGVTLFVLQVYVLIFHRGVPNIRTAPAIRKRIIDLIRDDCDKRGNSDKPYTVIDLGSGNGLMTREIAAALPHVKVVGLEIASQCIAWSNFFKRRKKLDNLDYISMDFFKYDLSTVDAVIVFQLPYLMKLLGQKLKDEAKPNTLILANMYKLYDGWQPVETLNIKTIYHNQGELHIYRKD